MTVDPADPWPVSLTYQEAQRTLDLVFDDGRAGSISAADLRRYSPSAETIGHDGIRRDVAGLDQVRVTAIDPVGRYAVRIIFSDGHRTGLYTWPYLYALMLGRFPETGQNK